MSPYFTLNAPKYRINYPSRDLTWNTGYVPLSQDRHPPQQACGLDSGLMGLEFMAHIPC